jgi:hypothetical protein
MDLFLLLAPDQFLSSAEQSLSSKAEGQTHPISLPHPTPGSAMLPNPYAGGPLNTNRSTACHILEPRPTKNFEDEDVAPALSSRLLLKKTLFRRGLAKRVVTVEMRYLPAAEPFRFEHRTMAGVLVVHSGKRFDETCC